MKSVNTPKIVWFGPLSKSTITSVLKERSQPLRLENVGSSTNITEEKLLESIRDASILLCNPATPHLTRERLEAARNLKLVQFMTIGYDGIDLQAATELEIPVANNPGCNSDSVAEYTIMLILMSLRRTTLTMKIVENGWTMKGLVSNFGLFREFKGKKLGIIGLGDVGREVVKRARCFGPDIIYFKRNRLSREEERSLGVEFKPFNELLAESDIVSLHVPLTAETTGLIGEEQIMLMKDGSVLINTARAEVIDEGAVAMALKSGKLSAAGLDFVNTRVVAGVFVPDSPLLECENVVLSPHVAGPTKESMLRSHLQWAENVDRFLDGKRPLYLVNDVKSSNYSYPK